MYHFFLSCPSFILTPSRSYVFYLQVLHRRGVREAEQESNYMYKLPLKPTTDSNGQRHT